MEYNSSQSLDMVGVVSSILAAPTNKQELALSARKHGQQLASLERAHALVDVPPWLGVKGAAAHLKQECADWLRTLDIPQLLALPERLSKPGVYFLLLAGELQYVGISTHMRDRITSHKSKNQIAFDSSRCLEVELSNRRELLEFEYIDRYQPPMNKAHRSQP